MSSIYRQADGVILLLRSLELCGTSTTNVRSLEPMVLVIFIQGKLLREMLFCGLGRCIQLKRVVWLKFGIRTMSDKATLFESASIADAYLKFRPTYGPDVYDTIVSFCKESQSNSFSLAVDVGCGSGQSTLPLTKRFSKVVGLDVSESQIAKAPTQFENLSFRVGPAEDLSFLDSGSADLVTVAQAMHWMDLDRFYPEVDRVLKPGGALVVYGYGQPRLDEPAAEETMNYLYRDVLGPYWTDGRNRVEEHYQSFSLPFPGWRRNDDLKIERSWTVDDFIGYLCSWSAYHKFLMEHPLDNTMPEVRQKMKSVYQEGGALADEREVKVMWPVFMLMGHKPQS